MIDFKIERRHLKKGYTIGKLFYKLDNGEWIYFCDTLEDEVRPSGQKVYGETAIPYGLYKFDIVVSPRFKVKMPYLLDVPGFVGIMIHWGNNSLWTEGCILIGENKIKGGLINSRNTFDNFMELILNHEQKEYNLLIC